MKVKDHMYNKHGRLLFEEDFDVRSSHDDECQEIIINRYFK